MNIQLIVRNKQQLAALIHCLNYGEAAASEQDYKDGTYKDRVDAISDFRRQLLDQAIK